VSPKRFAVYRKDQLVGLTWAQTAKQAIALYRRYTGLSASSAREEPS
jgi:hypothetical protein